MRAHLEPLPPDLVEGLSRAAAYPPERSGPRRVRHVQTHLSHVFLTRERVYKLRKAVDLGFASFATRAQRNADCAREVVLGRRLAADVYLGVVPVLRDPVRVGPFTDAARGRALPQSREHCVVMRRLPTGREALSLLRTHRLRPEQIDALAVHVAQFHRRHRLSARAHGTPAQWLERSTRPARDNFVLLAAAARGPDPIVPRALVRRAAALAERAIREGHARFEVRRRARRGVDGHGDLHLQHVFFERDAAPPLLIDCIEFSDRLRRIDAAAEVAFLAMDLRYRGRPDLAERFLAAYAAAADDHELYGVVDFYVGYRAAVRAKVATVAARDAALSGAQRRNAAESARRHLALAAAPPRRKSRPGIVVMCGTVGSGKTRVANAAARALRGAVVSTDVVRRAQGRADYSEAAKTRIYRELLVRARAVVASGRVAVLDATFDRTARRALARRLAAACGVSALLIEVRCAPAVVRARLARRAAAGADPSDAGPEEQAASVERFQPPREWPRAMRRVVRTDRPWRADLARALAPLPSR